MRKITAIAFFITFAFAQYAKQAVYLECKLANNFKSVAEKCDCNKKAGFDKKESGQPLSKTHTHIHLDELFPDNKQIFFDLIFYRVSRVLIFPGNEEICKNDHPAPDHPPQT